MDPDSEENYVDGLGSLWLVGLFSEIGEQEGEGILYSFLDHVRSKSIESGRGYGVGDLRTQSQGYRNQSECHERIAG